MGDFSTMSLPTVPMPNDLHWDPDKGYGSDFRSNEVPDRWNTPQRLVDYHGAQAKNLTMIVLMREPLSRTQSEWYHTRARENCAGCMAGNTFKDALAFNIRLLEQHNVSDWFWKNLYARQLEGYLNYFNASQFIIIPFKRYAFLDTFNVSKVLVERLGLDISPWDRARHSNYHYEKPPLDSELPVSAIERQDYQRLMAPENARLVRLLTGAHLNGMELLGFSGSPGDEQAVQTWLESSW